MNINKLMLFLIFPGFIMQTNIYNKNPLSIVNNCNQVVKRSLSSIFLNDRLDNEIHTGSAENLTKISDTVIRQAVNKEVLAELVSKTGNDSITSILDYDIVIMTKDNQPLPNTINLTQPLNIKITITAKPISRIFKDQAIVEATIKYPIFSFDDFLQEGLLKIYQVTHPGEAQELEFSDSFVSNYHQSNYYIKTIGQPTLDKNISTFNYFGESLFENNSDEPQTYPTVSETKEVVNEIKVSLSQGISVGSGFTFNFFNAEVKVDFKKQETTSNSVKKSITAPSVPTTVSPHQKMQVLVFLNDIVSSQNILIDSDITGTSSLTMHFKSGWQEVYTLDVTDIIKYYLDIEACPLGLSLNSDQKSIHLDNQAQVVKYEAGSFWRVITNPIN